MSVVSTEYRHATKVIRRCAPIALGESVLKWYDIAPADEPVPSELHVLARGTLHAAAEAGLLDLEDELGFVILHRCGESFYFLLISTWRNENELWETVWAKNGEDEVGFRPWPREGTHRPDLLRVGARRGVARAAGVEPLPPLVARRRRAGGLPARHVRRDRLTTGRSGARRS